MIVYDICKLYMHICMCENQRSMLVVQLHHTLIYVLRMINTWMVKRERNRKERDRERERVSGKENGKEERKGEEKEKEKELYLGNVHLDKLG